MASAVDQEVEAIKALLTALEPLSPDSRRAAVDYVTRRLGIPWTPAAGAEALLTGGAGTSPPPREAPAPGTVHIKALKEQKKPKSAQEMAALVAYYLSHLVPTAERKQTVNAKDIETYFKIADFRLPEQPRFTLPNTKKAGYLDAAGAGDYKLNPVGYNLIVHSLPRSGAADSGRGRRRPRSKGGAKKAAKRPSSARK